MRFDKADLIEDVIWNSRIADLPRSELRTILQRLYGGEPPFDQDKAEENDIQINRNNLSGVNLLSQARRQWNQAFLSTKNYFTVNLDSGPREKRMEWSGIITKNINRLLKRNGAMREQIRATGANVMLHGIGPVNWSDRRTPIPRPIPISSLLIASETEISFDNLEWFAVFREWTPSQLYTLTHGTKVDPGWNMGMVRNQLKYVAEQVQKQPNATAYQYMPERVEELIKQDLGFWGSDAVPTVDVWDFYFREKGDGDGWYRRIVLDWGIGDSSMSTYAKTGRPESRNKDGDKYAFLYTSGKRKYANRLSEIIHCQFGDCSAYAPFNYHSVRSLGWMLWGPSDLDNRLYCKVMENTFMNQMWWFRVAGEAAFTRLKKADFFHFGVIPNGVSMIPAGERFQPDARLTQLGIDWNRRLMSENAASYTQDFNKGESGKEMTATETMARVNSVNAMVSGMLALAYDYEVSKDREICRRFCIKGNPDRDAAEFRKSCLAAKVPPEMLDVERWDVQPERTIGGGNKTLEMATIQFLNSLRTHFGPQGQRLIDHMTVFSATDQPDLAEAIAPLDEIKTPSNSMHDAELSTPRILAGLPFRDKPDMVYEDYVMVWLHDMAGEIQRILQTTAVPTPTELIGLNNLGSHIGKFIQILDQNPEEKPKLKQYQDALGQMMNHVKAFTQRLQQQQKKQIGQGNGETQAKLQGQLMINAAKAQNLRESHALRTAQKQTQFELEQQRDDARLQADIRRQNLEHRAEMGRDAANAILDMHKQRVKMFQE